MRKIVVEGGFSVPENNSILEFNNELKCVTILYTRILPKLAIKPLTKIFIKVFDSKDKEYIAKPSKTASACIIFKYFSLNDFFVKPELERKTILLDLVQRSILEACDELGWDKVPFEYTYQEIVRRNFKANFLMWKGKLFKRRNTGIIGVDLDITKTEAIMSIKFFNNNQELLKQIEVFRFRPDLHFLNPMIGSAKWVSDEEFVIFNKRKDIQFKVNIVYDKVEIKFVPDDFSLEYLQDQLRIADAGTSKEELENIFKGKINR